MKTSNQVDGANDEVISNKRGKKKSKMIKVSLQLDGTGPPVNSLSFSHLRMIISFKCRLVMMKTTMKIVKRKE
jgi:hypothetical protein